MPGSSEGQGAPDVELDDFLRSMGDVIKRSSELDEEDIQAAKSVLTASLSMRVSEDSISFLTEAIESALRLEWREARGFLLLLTFSDEWLERAAQLHPGTDPVRLKNLSRPFRHQLRDFFRARTQGARDWQRARAPVRRQSTFASPSAPHIPTSGLPRP